MKRIAFILVLLLLIGCSMDSHRTDLPFNSEVWKKSDNRVRGRMSIDLQNSKLLINKSEPEVKELVGEPSKNAGDFWIYDVDMGELLNYQFNVYFDKENDKVTLSYVAN